MSPRRISTFRSHCSQEVIYSCCAQEGSKHQQKSFCDITGKDKGNSWRDWSRKSSVQALAQGEKRGKSKWRGNNNLFLMKWLIWLAFWYVYYMERWAAGDSFDLQQPDYRIMTADGGSAHISCSGHRAQLFEVLPSPPFLFTVKKQTTSPGQVRRASKFPQSQEVCRGDHGQTCKIAHIAFQCLSITPSLHLNPRQVVGIFFCLS